VAGHSQGTSAVSYLWRNNIKLLPRNEENVNEDWGQVPLHLPGETDYSTESRLIICTRLSIGNDEPLATAFFARVGERVETAV
jgi:hypothetical protein